MRFEITFNTETLQTDLADGVVTVGGGASDGIRLDGLPDALLELTINGDTLMVVAKRSVLIGEAPFPKCVSRLVLEGEVIRLAPHVALRRPLEALLPARRQSVGTAFVAQALLKGDGFSLLESRAATLFCVSGVDLGTTYSLASDEVRIGRSARAEVRMHDASVSREHAKLLQEKGRFTLITCNPRNAMYVNGKPVRRPTPLLSGDVVELGQSVLRFTGPEQSADDVTAIVTAEPGTTLPALPSSTLPEARAEPRSLEAFEPALSPRAATAYMVMGAVATAVGLGVAFSVF